MSLKKKTKKKFSQYSWVIILTTAHPRNLNHKGCSLFPPAWRCNEFSLPLSFTPLSLSGCPPCSRNGPQWGRADLRGRSFKESRNLSEQRSHRLRQTAARITRRIITAPQECIDLCFHPLVIYDLENLSYFELSCITCETCISALWIYNSRMTK